MKKSLENFVRKFVSEYKNNNNTITDWKAPIIGYADARDPLFEEYETVIGKNHITPIRGLVSANTVITYFIPFVEETVESNTGGKMASMDWAFAYVETNRLLEDLSLAIKERLEAKGYETIIPEERQFIRETISSNYSQRHMAYVAGIGTFGLNNMLITEEGCAGRYGSVITELKIKPTERPAEEFCLYKSKKLCRTCVDACPTGALIVEGFDKAKCLDHLDENQELYKNLGSCEVCGKCISNAKCKYTRL